MRAMIAIGAAALLALLAGVWVAWRMGIAGGAALPGPLATLQAHWRQRGLELRGVLVKRPHQSGSDLRAKAQFESAATGAFDVYWYETPEAAGASRDRSAPSTQRGAIEANGPLVLVLPPELAASPAGRALREAFLGADLTGRAAPAKEAP